MKYKIYLSGEIHSNWREAIINDVNKTKLDIQFLTPETDHAMSDDCGDNIVGAAPNAFWKDQQSASINAIRIRHNIQQADIVIVKFGEKYKQWNAAFEAGMASALGKGLVIIHPKEFGHALKDLDVAANAVVETEDQVIKLLQYLYR